MKELATSISELNNWGIIMKKKVLSLLTVLAMSIALVACGKSNTEVSADTIGGKYVNAFNASSASTCSDIIEDLINNVETEMALVQVEVEPGYLNGFDNEISGFDNGAMFAPMIGSIPFVGYVFETSDAAALEDSLKANANLRWNICTEADEMVSATNGKFVFFMMCSNED